MRCTVTSSSGQVMAMGYLFLQKDEEGELRLAFRSDRGRLIEGGLVGDDGDLSSASQELFRQFFTTWGMSGLTLTIGARS